MSTFTGVAPALDLDGAPPQPHAYGLLSIPGVLQTGEGGRPLGGVNVDPYPSAVPALWEPCSSGTFRAKGEGDLPATLLFTPFGMYVPISCSALSVGDWREFASRAQDKLEAGLSYGLELALSRGVTLSSNKFLGDSDVTVLGGGAVTPEVGLRWLENAIGATGQAGLLHADPAVASAWSQLVQSEGETLRTISNDTPVSVGGGYIGAPANGSAPASGSSYAFASGPVQVFLSEPQLTGDDINGSLDTSNNDVTFRAERYALVQWDGVLQSAVLIDWTP